jgi:hypothetical protein
MVGNFKDREWVKVRLLQYYREVDRLDKDWADSAEDSREAILRRIAEAHSDDQEILLLAAMCCCRLGSDDSCRDAHALFDQARRLGENPAVQQLLKRAEEEIYLMERKFASG